MSLVSSVQESAHLLVVDDLEVNRDLLGRRLQRMGHTVAFAENGEEALAKLKSDAFDMVLLDITMPVLDGYQTLKALKDDPQLQHIPVVMVSAIDEIESVARCIEFGADDYLTKPFNATLLKARVTQSLGRKRFHDAEKNMLAQLKVAQEKSARLLHNVLPSAIAQQLQDSDWYDHAQIAQHYDQATVLFADLVGFTPLSGALGANGLVNLLNVIFSAFDELTLSHGVEKIKTIGDCYMAAAGVPMPHPRHAHQSVALALDMLKAMAQINRSHGLDLALRIGIHTGPVVAGVIGKHKFIYDLWGDTVNTASRMESHGLPNAIQITEDLARVVDQDFEVVSRGSIAIKGKSDMQTYWVTAAKLTSIPNTPTNLAEP